MLEYIVCLLAWACLLALTWALWGVQKSLQDLRTVVEIQSDQIQRLQKQCLRQTTAKSTVSPTESDSAKVGDSVL